MLGPLGLAQQCEHAHCLVTRPTFGSSAFNGVLAVAAADVTLRRAVALDLTLPFLGAALLGFRDFAMEMVDMGLGSVGSRRRN
jgi:hypothetical protein